MKNFYIRPYHRASESAKLLANALDCWRITSGRTFRPRDNKVILNWGKTDNRYDETCDVLNKARFTRVVSNKLRFFETYSNAVHPGFRTLDFTTAYDRALEWINQGHKVCCRTVLDGHSGAGLVVAETADQLVRAPLYTKYKKKQAEYRVHVFDGDVIAVQRKVARAGINPLNWFIRNHDNGFVFQRNNLNVPEDVKNQAINACRFFYLDMGGVDVIWNEREQQAYVIEINTAPGIEGETVNDYANAIRKFMEKQ